MRELKDSGISFVGNIPDNWKVLKNKRCFELEKDIVGPKFEEYQLLSLTKRGVILKDINNTYGKTPESYETYQSVKRGQLIMCLFDLDISAVFSGITDYNGMISPAYKIYNCKNNIYNRYAGYWFDFCFDGRKYMSFSKSLRYVVNTDDFKDIEIIVPPLEQQYKIVQFLDKKIIEIDNVIAKTKQTIEDYKLYKKAIITKAVTKGIDNNVEMKDSGIDYIGMVPKHWKIIKLKYIAKDICKGNGITKEDIVLDGNVHCVRYGEIYSKYDYKFYECLTKTNKENVRSKQYFSYGDLLFAGTGELVEEIGKNIVYLGNENCLAGGDIIVVKHSESPLFMSYALNSNYSQIQKSYGKSKLKVVHISGEEIGNIKVLLPPKVEQEKIEKFILKKCNKIDLLIKNKEQIIEELDKYRKALIYEYVTGKKEVEKKKVNNTDNINEIKINCKDNVFAQAILLCKIIEKLRNYNLGRVKAEKTLYLIEKEVGFDFNNKYVREAAGPLSENLYKCESIISKNKWVNIKKVKKYIEYEILPNFNKYSKYYDKYYSSYDSQIENIIDMVKNYSTDKAEMVATLYASWNDFIIKKDKVPEIEIVRDVRENWNDRKKRFNEREWLEVLEEMKRIGLTPKGNGNLTVIKE